MPVKAAIESRMIQFWFYGQCAVGVGNACLVREFPLHASQRQLGKVGGAFDGEFVLTGVEPEMGVGLGGNSCCVLYTNEGGQDDLIHFGLFRAEYGPYLW